MNMRILAAAVGAGGANRRDDAALVQLLLNVERHNARKTSLLSVDGEVGAQTIAAIQEFQRLYLRITPDGLVQPNGLTIKGLAFAWCTWLGAAKIGTYTPPNFAFDPTWPSMRETLADSVQATLIDIKAFLATLLPPPSVRPPGPGPRPDLRPDLEEFRPPRPTPDVA